MTEGELVSAHRVSNAAIDTLVIGMGPPSNVCLHLHLLVSFLQLSGQAQDFILAPAFPVTAMVGTVQS